MPEHTCQYLVNDLNCLPASQTQPSNDKKFPHACNFSHQNKTKAKSCKFRLFCDICREQEERAALDLAVGSLQLSLTGEEAS